MDYQILKQPPIDLVYLWCDDNDKEWNTKRLQYMRREKLLDVQAVHPCRYTNHDELLYSLRSAAKYAPWINRIFIVSDHQIPSWLNVKHPKIRLINHEDILPPEVLPTFNSIAIETALGNIPELSERFLFANDDTFFGAPVNPDFFYSPDGKVIFRVCRPPKKKKIIGSQYSRCVVSAQELALQKVDVRCDWFPHHNIDAYLKTDYQACINYFKSEADKTSRQRFRQDGALHRVIVSYYMMAAGHAVIKPVKDIDINLSLMEKLKRFVLRQKAPDSFCTNIHSPRGFAKLMRIRPKLFCINDTEKGSVENVDVKIFLEKCFRINAILSYEQESLPLGGFLISNSGRR